MSGEIRPKRNEFYKTALFDDMLQISPQFRDLPASTGDTIKLSSNETKTYSLATVKKPETPLYGNSDLKGCTLQLFSNGIESDDTRALGYLNIYRGNPDLDVTEGGFSLAKRGTTSNVIGGTISTYISRPNNPFYLRNEEFEGDNRNLGSISRVGNNNVVTYSNPYILLPDLVYLINAEFGTGFTLPEQVSSVNNNFGFDYLDVEQGVVSRLRNTVSEHRVAVDFNDDADGNRTSWTPRFKNNLKGLIMKGFVGSWDRSFPNVPFYTQHIQYADQVTSTVDAESAPFASTGNTIFDAFASTADKSNPFDTTDEDPLLFSATELSTEKSTNGGQSLRFYHNWGYSANNIPLIQNQIGVSGSINPQMSRAVLKNIPLPAAPFDIGNNTINNNSSTLMLGNHQSVPAEIQMKMNISKLDPTPIYNVASADDVDSVYGMYNNATLTKAHCGTDGLSLLRGVTITFSNYEPNDTDTSLDKFLYRGLRSFYANMSKVVGGVTFFKTGIDGSPNLSPGSVGDAASGNSVIAMPLPVTLIAQGTSGSTNEKSTIMKVAGMARLSGSSSGKIQNSYAMTMGNLPVVSTISNRLVDANMPQYLELDSNSWFDMKIYMNGMMYNNTGSATRNPYSGSNAYATEAQRGSAMRIYFSTQRSSSLENDNWDFLDIPFPARSASDPSYNWLDNPEHFPHCMTVWVQNYCWVSSADTGFGGDDTDGRLFSKGDNAVTPSGSVKEAEVFIDDIKFVNFTPATTNVTANAYSGPLSLKPSSILSPLASAISGTSYLKRWQASAGTLEPDVSNQGGGSLHPYDVGQYICFGFNQNVDWATTGSSEGSGYFLFNDFHSNSFIGVSGSAVGETMFKNRGFANPASLATAGAMISREGVKAADGTTTIFVPLGGQMSSNKGVYISGGTAATQFDVLSGSNYVISTGAAADNTICLGQGSNTFYSTDSLRQKGFVYMNLKGADTYDNWGKTEHISVSTKIIEISPTSEELNMVMGPSIKVQDPTIFNWTDDDETYRIYLMGANRASNANYRSGLKLNSKYINSEGILTFTALDPFDASSGAELVTEDNLPFLWIGPEKYWITMLLDTPSNLTPRTWTNICMVDETPSDSSDAQLGSTFNEFKYSYNTGLEGSVKSGIYTNPWDLTNAFTGDRIIILDEDNGFGAFDEATGEGGELARGSLIPGYYNYLDMDPLVSKKDIDPGTSFPLYFTYNGPQAVKSQTITTDNESTDIEYKPRLYWRYEDLPPIVTNLEVNPAFSLLEPNTNLYNLTSENLNAVEFTWEENNADDVWYRYLIISDDEPILDKYHNAQLWWPLNDVPTSPSELGSSIDWTVYKPYLNTSASSNGGATARAVLDGQAGWACNPNGAATNGRVITPYGTNTALHGLTEFSLVVHWTPSAADKGTLSYVCAQTDALGTPTNHFEMFKNTSDKLVVKLGADTAITGTSLVTCDGETPTSIILTLNSGSSDPIKTKLYQDGKLVARASTSTGVGGAGTPDFTIAENDGTATYRGSTGKFEEIVIYRNEIDVISSPSNYIYNTRDELDISGTNDINKNARVFVCDYHNFRGKNPRDIGMSNMATWRATTI